MSNCNDSWRGKDKVKHFGVCLVLAGICHIVAVVAAVAKEVHDDGTEGNHWCWKDIVADVEGVHCMWGSLMKRVSKEATRRDGDGVINSQIL